MKFSLESRSDINIITSHDSDHIIIRVRNNPELLRLEFPLILSPQTVIQEQLLAKPFTMDDIEYIKNLEAEVLIISQSKGVISPSERELFFSQLLSNETMSLGAACRTYNLLANEDRRVILIVRR